MHLSESTSGSAHLYPFLIASQDAPRSSLALLKDNHLVPMNLRYCHPDNAIRFLVL
jgi:hypothetical protein